MTNRALVFAGIVTLMSVMGAQSVDAQQRAVQLSLVNPIQLFPETDSIVGVRINLIYGRNAAVTGLDWGLVNHTVGGLTKGWQTGLVGYAEGGFVGLQDNGINIAKVRFVGVQVGGVNVIEQGEGVQLGAFSYARQFNGLQFSVINYAQRLEGIQIGLINIIREGGALPVLPIINWSFEGSR